MGNLKIPENSGLVFFVMSNIGRERERERERERNMLELMGSLLALLVKC
jgi:hypothetical protein